MLNITGILGDKYMDRFKVFHEQTLFPPTWESLLHDRCPLCNNKLKFPLNRKIAICGGTKHRKPFVIGLDKLKDVKNSIDH